MVHGAVRKLFVFLEPADEITQFLPGNLLWPLMEKAGEISEIGADVGGIRIYGMVSKTAQGDHLPEL